METTMDISQINDVQQLKAMAYDAIATKEQAEANLRIINQRIAQVTAMPPTEESSNDK